MDAEYARRKRERIEHLRSGKFAFEDENDLADTNSKLKQADNQRLLFQTQYLTHFVRDIDKQTAEAQVVVWEAQLGAAKQRLAETTLTSPIDGTILENIFRVGEATYSAGSPEPVLWVGNLVLNFINKRYKD